MDTMDMDMDMTTGTEVVICICICGIHISVPGRFSVPVLITSQGPNWTAKDQNLHQ